MVADTYTPFIFIDADARELLLPRRASINTIYIWVDYASRKITRTRMLYSLRKLLFYTAMDIIDLLMILPLSPRARHLPVI